MKKIISIALIIMLALVLVAPVLAGPPKGTGTTFLVDHDGNYGKVTTSGAQLGVTADYAHHENHSGNSYSSTYNAELASGAATTFLINTPAGSTVGHAVFLLRSSGESNLKIYEFSTISNVGTALQETQHNRNSSNTASIEITRAPTVTGLGNSLDGFEAHVGAGQQRGGEARGIFELILKAETLYIANAVSEAANNDVTLGMAWYEDSGDAP